MIFSESRLKPYKPPGKAVYYEMTGHRSSSVYELKSILPDSWKDLFAKLLHKLFDSMPGNILVLQSIRLFYNLQPKNLLCYFNIGLN